MSLGKQAIQTADGVIPTAYIFPLSLSQIGIASVISYRRIIFYYQVYLILNWLYYSWWTLLWVFSGVGKYCQDSILNLHLICYYISSAHLLSGVWIYSGLKRMPKNIHRLYSFDLSHEQVTTDSVRYSPYGKHWISYRSGKTGSPGNVQIQG